MQPAAVPSRTFRINLWLHRWTSLIATPLFLVLCITGTVLIFHEEIDAAMGYVPSATASAHARPLADSVAAVQAKYPNERVSTIAYDPQEHPGVLLAFITPKGDTGFEHGRSVYVDTANARLVEGTDPQRTLTGLLFELHAEWFLGPAGELVGALIALLVLISVISGVVIYAPYVKRAAFGVLRRGRGGDSCSSISITSSARLCSAGSSSSRPPGCCWASAQSPVRSGRTQSFRR